MTRSFDTLREAVDTLQKEGYTEDFNLKYNCIECSGDNAQYDTNQFVVKEVYRFEGMTNPDDNSVVYAVETSDGRKGLIVDAYGAYADPVSVEMIEKLQIRRQNL